MAPKKFKHTLCLRYKGGKRDLDNINTVIIPSICLGNAAQMACDLLIATKQMKCIGIIEGPALIPVFGPPAYQHESVMSAGACALYLDKEDRQLVIQFRTPLVSTHFDDLYDLIFKIIPRKAVVIVLAASFGLEGYDLEGADFNKSPYAYRASIEFELTAYGDRLDKEEESSCKWPKFKGDTLYGSGNAMSLFRRFSEKPTLLLFRHQMNGENITDAKLIVQELEKFLGRSLPAHIDVPISWKLMFGNDSNELLF